MYPLALRWWRRQHFAHPVRLQRSEQTGGFHSFDHSSGAVVADLEPALNAGNRRLPTLYDNPHRLVIQGILLDVAAAFLLDALLQLRWKSRNKVARTGQDLIDVSRRIAFHAADDA